MFYQTQAGAAITDTILSLIATCQRAGISTFDYLAVLQRHASVVKQTRAALALEVSTRPAMP